PWECSCNLRSPMTWSSSRSTLLHLLRSPLGTKPKSTHVRCYVRFSNRPFEVKRFQTIHHDGVDVAPRARASLRNRHQGPSIMGFEDEVERSHGRPMGGLTVR